MSDLHNLLGEYVQRFIREHAFSDVRALALQTSPFKNVSSAELAAQIAGLQKAKEKIPLYHQTEGIVFPPGINLEQSSSQATALYKASLVSKIINKSESSVADLTGGFGIDTFFLSKTCESITHIEPDGSLQQTSKHNHQQLGATKIAYVNTRAEDFLNSNSSSFDLMFIDPSRRVESRKVVGLQDCVPDVVALQETIFQHSDNLLIKTSPLLDLSAAIGSLTSVREVHVASVGNECKELLFWCSKEFVGTPAILAVELSGNGDIKSTFSFNQKEEAIASANFNEPQTFLYEPNAAILKAGAFKSIAQQLQINKLAPSTHLYTSQTLIKGFPGRAFRIEQFIKADVKSLHTALPEKKANVITRNYPLTPEELKKKLKLTDGGEKYILGFSGLKKKHLVVCTRL